MSKLNSRQSNRGLGELAQRVLIIAGWADLLLAIVVSVWFYLTTNEGPNERAVGTLITFSLFGSLAFMAAFALVINSIGQVFRKEQVSIAAILTSLAIVLSPFVLGFFIQLR